VPLRSPDVLVMLPQPRELARESPPSLRTVIRHLRAIRATPRSAES
jgi:hypothetical protein